MPKPANKRGAKSAPEPASRCGYVALIGAPNAGKSTLLNQLVGRKLAIVTPKVQTTRTRLLGIAIIGPAQVILIDTPGIFEPRRRLDRAMVAAAWAGAADADQTVLLVDAARPNDRHTPRHVRRLARAMVAAAWAGAADADQTVLLVDAARPNDRDTQRIVGRLAETGRRAILALNKIDVVRRDKLLGLADTLFKTGVFSAGFMVSAPNS